MTKRFLALFLLLVPGCLFAQQITITGTVKDPNGVPFTNGSGRVILVPTNVSFTTGLTNPVPGSQSPVVINGLDAFGRFSVALTSTAAIDQQPSNPQWLFTFCSAPILQFGPICFTMAPLSLTSSQDITTQISATPPPVLPAAGPGGALPAPPPGTLQKANNPPSGFAASNLLEPVSGGAKPNLIGSLSLGEDVAPLGPNPYVDVRQYGVRFCNFATTPCSTGLTATTTSGSPSVTISSASTFVNGDGVVIYGAGAPHALTTPGAPTVVSAVSAGGTATGIVSTYALTGASTYCYKIVARDKAGGLTAASAESCTSTGVTTLGANTVNITSSSRSGDVVTVTTTSPHGFKGGCAGTQPGFVCGEVFIGSGGTDASFRGWFLVTSAPSTTTFTYSTYLDARNGATSSSTGGTATWYSANRVTWTPVTGASQYYIYAGASGAETLYAASMLEGTNTDFTFDDYGSTIVGGASFPPYVPTNPPGSATSDNLATTISVGGGTTSLTLAANAGTSVAGATVRLDASAGLLAAATVANALNGAGTLLLPVATSLNQGIVVNSYLDTHNLRFAVQQSGLLVLNETWQVGPIGTGDAVRWEGVLPQNATPPSNAWQPNPTVQINTANPGVYVNSGNDVTIKGISFSGLAGGNSARLVLVEGGFNQTYESDSFVSGSGSVDVGGIGLYLRGVAGAGSAGNIIIDRVLFSGGATSDGVSHTPIFYCNDCGDLQVRSAYYLHRGAVINGDPAGFLTTDIQHSYINGGFQPLYTRVNGNTSDSWFIGSIVMDTIPHPCVAVFSGVGLVSRGNGGVVDLPCSPFNGVPPYSGLRVAQYLTGKLNDGSRDNFNIISQSSGAFDGIFGTNDGPYSVFGVNGGIATGLNYTIFVTGATTSAPTCSVSAGGSLAIGSYQFQVVPVWANNGEGTYSAKSTTCTTSTGNQTITINWTITPGSPKAMRLYANGLEDNAFTDPFPTGTTSFVWTTGGTSISAAKVSAGTLPTAGPTMMMPGLQGIQTPAFVLSGSNPATAMQGTDTKLLTAGTVTGTGTTLCTDANGGATTSSCITSTAIQSQSFTSLGGNVTVGNTATTIMSLALTMPAAGCPCRVRIDYGLYLDFPNTNVTAWAFWVNDGTAGSTHTLASLQTDQSNGSTGARTSANSGAFTQLTYANNAAVTFTLFGQGTGATTMTVEAAPQVGSGTNSWMSAVIQTSN